MCFAWDGQDGFLNTKGTKVFLVCFLFKDKGRGQETAERLDKNYPHLIKLPLHNKLDWFIVQKEKCGYITKRKDC